jgi:gliding motility-associated-like protein
LNSTTNTVGVDFTGTATSGTLSVKSVLNGCESTPLTTAVTVIPIASTIKPDFTIPSVCASATALFTNTTDPATANISSFAWDFGNGQTATTKNGTATYSTAGVYAVKLTATVTACPSITGSITKNITVLNPTAGIAYDTITAVRGVPVNLSARNIGTTYSWSPVTGLSFPNSASTSLVPTQTQRFLINITAANGCTTVDTQFVQVASKTGLYIPTMFSPNGDGRNDLLAPLPVAITKLNFFRVYNRWGNIVYEQRNTMGAGIGWNGKYKGIDQPVGVYIWVAEGVDIDNKIVRVDGNTVLIR